MPDAVGADVPVRLEPGPRAIRTSGLVKRFGKETALAGLDLAVPEGAVYLLAGPNGAGKTTTLRILLALLRPDEGRAEVVGMDTRESPHRIRALIGYVPERRGFHYGWMKVRDLLDFHAGYHPSWDHAYARHLRERLEVGREKTYATLSRGQARRVQLLMALAHRPPLLILDEPTAGLDPLGRNRLIRLLGDHLASTPTTVLLSSHLVSEVERLADHLGVVREGRLTAQVAREDLTRRLKRYVLAPGGGEGAGPGGEAGLTVVARGRTGSDTALTLWGEEHVVVEKLRSAGATIRRVAPLTLAEAALALLGRDGGVPDREGA